MKRNSSNSRRGTLIMLAMAAWAVPAAAWATNLRIVTYNIDDDTGGTSQTDARTNMSDLSVILQAIGNHTLAGNSQPIDVLALQELHNDNPSTSSSLTAIVNQLNSVYGAGTYAYDPYVGITDGNGLSGNGPNGLIYNTHTVKDLGAVGIGTVSGSGVPRQPVRYELAPIGYGANSDFYLYVSHYKSGTGSDNETRRNDEAQEIRADADTLGASAHIIYAGDFNLNGAGSQKSRTELASNEAAYQTLTAAGNGQANDPLNATNWDNTAAFASIETEEGDSVTARYDFQLVSNATLNQSGVQLIPNTYTTFGNGGATQTFSGTVNYANNHTLDDLSNHSAVLQLLADRTDVTDHLPVIADYATVSITPSPLDKYYVGSNNGTWSPGSNWSLTAGGTGGAGVPGYLENAHVTGSVSTTVNFDTIYTTNAAIGSLTIGGTGGATAAVSQSANTVLAISGSLTLGANAGDKGTYALSGGTLSVGGVELIGNSGTATFTQSGGTHTVAGSLILGSSASSSGTYVLSAGALSAASANLKTNGSFQFNGGNASLGNLSLTGNGQLNMSSGKNKALVLNSLAITGTATLDLSDNAMIVNYGSETTGSTQATIRNLLINGRNAGPAAPAPWNGTGGITSSFAHANGNGFNLAIGYADNAALASINAAGSYTSFGGQTVGSTTILVKMTYGADANLDGKVDGSDVSIIGTHFNQPGSGQWYFGDFDYSGMCDGNDISVLGTTFGQTSPTLSPADLTAEFGSAFTAAFETGQAGTVPEPASLSLLGIFGLAMLTRHRRLAQSHPLG